MNILHKPIMLMIVLVSIVTAFVSVALANKGKTRYRSVVLKELAQAETAFAKSPSNVASRKQYATLLFQTGDFWKANTMAQPLLEDSKKDVESLHLGARLAYLVADYEKAEKLLKRILNLARKGTKEYNRAIHGLALICFQTHQYAKIRDLPEIEEFKETADMMKAFPGKPYAVEWPDEEKTAVVPFWTDPKLPLPILQVRVNGADLKFILDTGGNLFYIDKGVAERIGLEKLTEHKAKYAYTGGETVKEYYGRADTVTMGGVTIKNVPMTLAEWKSRGIDCDGVLTTQVLKEFIFTIDYANERMIFRERSQRGLTQLKASLQGKETVEIPFVLDSTHLLFARGSMNGTEGLTFLVDSGLALTLPFIGMDGMLEDMKIATTTMEGTKFRLFNISSLGLGSLVLDKRTQGLAGGSIMVGEPQYWSQGFIWDGLISHQYLKNFSSWTIDFDAMKFIFAK